MSIRGSEPRGTSALRALVIVGVAGATLCGWVLVRDGSHHALIGAANCPNCADPATTTPAGGHRAAAGVTRTTSPPARGRGAAAAGVTSPAATAGSEVSGLAVAGGGTAVMAPLPALGQMRYSVTRQPDGSWLGQMQAVNPSALPVGVWELRLRMPGVREVTATYGLVSWHGSQVDVVGVGGGPVPAGGTLTVWLRVDGGQGAAPWPLDCRIDQVPCALGAAAGTGGPSATDPASWAAGSH